MKGIDILGLNLGETYLKGSTTDTPNELSNFCCESEAIEASLFKDWSRSEYSPACFGHCQEFYLSNFGLRGSFNFIFRVVLKHKHTCKVNSVLNFDFPFDDLCFALI